MSQLWAQLDFVRIATHSHSMLSGGERQLFGVAAAIVHRPEILILDEPEMHLDISNTRLLRQVIGSALAEGQAVVCTSRLEDFPETLAWTGPDAPENGELSELPVCPRRVNVNAPAVEFDRVNFKYQWLPSHPLAAGPILDDVSFSVPWGCVTGLTGPNGCGKTTLAKLMLGLLRPEWGTIRVGGNDTAGRRASEIARDIGLVFQNPSHQLYRGSVRAEIQWGLATSGRSGTANQAHLVGAIAQSLGVKGYLHENPFDLPWSRRRLATIACTIAREPGVLVLDEPTAGLDEVECRCVGNIMRQWARTGGAVVAITHDAEWASRNCDRQLRVVSNHGLIHHVE